ncbi:MAG TPA: thioredoxin domain-containing protein [bacterium]|nr:thioredoxin domain-containing protein [bacterium]
MSGGKAVFIEISASWCVACREMHPVTMKLYEIFKSKAFFVRIMLSKSTEEAETPTFPVMEIQSSPESLSIQSSQILPRIIIIDRSGELAADISGQYPVLYYYGILSEL